MSLMDTIFYSKKRYSLLCLLYNNNELDIDDINNYLNETSVSILPQIKKLIECNLIENNSGKYKLTPIGKLISKKVKQYIKKIELFEKNIDFWSNINFSGVPTFITDNIGNLDSIYILNINLNSNNESILEKTLKYVNHLTMIINNNYEMYYNILKYRIKNDLYTKLITTELIMDILLKKINKLDLKNVKNLKYNKILSCSNTFEIIVTSDILILSFKNTKRDLDTVSFIISCNANSLKLGNEIINYFERKKEQKMSNNE